MPDDHRDPLFADRRADRLELEGVGHGDQGHPVDQGQPEPGVEAEDVEERQVAEDRVVRPVLEDAVHPLDVRDEVAVGEGNGLRVGLAAAGEEDDHRVVRLAAVDRPDDAVGGERGLEQALDLGAPPDTRGDVLDEDHPLHLGAFDLREQRARRDDGLEPEAALRHPAVLSGAGRVVDHHRRPPAHHRGDDGENGAGGRRDHHAEEAGIVGVELLREDQRPEEGRLVGDAVAGCAVRDRQLVGILLGGPDEHLHEGHGCLQVRTMLMQI